MKLEYTFGPLLTQSLVGPLQDVQCMHSDIKLAAQYAAFSSVSTMSPIDGCAG